MSLSPGFVTPILPWFILPWFVQVGHGQPSLRRDMPWDLQHEHTAFGPSIFEDLIIISYMINGKDAPSGELIAICFDHI